MKFKLYTFFWKFKLSEKFKSCCSIIIQSFGVVEANNLKLMHPGQQVARLTD